VLALSFRSLSALAQAIRIERPAPGTLRRGLLGLDAPSAGAVVLLASIAAVVVVLGLAVARRTRRVRR
jgi:hypothetical protein